MIVYNAIKTPDGTVISSRFRHQYVTHIDANGKMYMVDGGLDYLRRSGHNDEEELSLTHESPFDQIREHFTWGTYGKSGKEIIKFIPLKDLEEEHIINIIESPTIFEITKELMTKELEYRKANSGDHPS